MYLTQWLSGNAVVYGPCIRAQQKFLKLSALAFTLFIFCGWITETIASSLVNVLSKFVTSRLLSLNVGLNGASIFNLISFSWSISANHGWAKMSRMPFLVPRRFAGSFSRSYKKLECMSFNSYLSNEILTLCGHRYLMTLRIWEVDWFCLDQLVHFLVVVVSSIEGRETDNHLVGENSDSPPINWERVALFSENFRSKVIRSATEREGLCITF